MKWPVSGFVLFMLTPTVSVEAGSELCEVPRQWSDTRPDPDGVPTRVSVGLFVIGIGNINDVQQTYTADFQLMLQWKDSRLANGGKAPGLEHCQVGLNKVWHPQAHVANLRTLTKHNDDTVKIDAEGTVTYLQRFSGDLSSSYELIDFPLDSHVFSITIASFSYGPQEVLFSVNEKETGQVDSLTIPGWSIGSWNAKVSSVYFSHEDRRYSLFNYDFEATRLAGFYFWKVVVPLLLIVLMSWIVFWIDPTQLIPQVALSATSMLTLVAFQFPLGQLLPRVSYLTRMDKFVLSCMVLVFLAVVEVATACILTGRGNRQLADRVDYWSRMIFPASFALLFTYAFWF